MRDTITDVPPERPVLSPDARHRAQLAGVAEAYFPNVKDAWGHTLKLVERELRPEENVHAAIGCFHDATLRLGLLFVTNARLLWTKQSFFRRRPRYVTIWYDDLVGIEFEYDEKWSRPALRSVLSDVTESRRAEVFSFDEERYGALPSFLKILQAMVDDKLRFTLDPEDLSGRSQR